MHAAASSGLPVFSGSRRMIQGRASSIKPAELEAVSRRSRQDRVDRELGGIRGRQHLGPTDEDHPARHGEADSRRDHDPDHRRGKPVAAEEPDVFGEIESQGETHRNPERVAQGVGQELAEDRSRPRVVEGQAAIEGEVPDQAQKIDKAPAVASGQMSWNKA